MIQQSSLKAASISSHEATDVIVIGSGIGGLSCAALLARYGFDVTVCESYSIPGGAAHTFERNGFKFDSGPSLYSGQSQLNLVYCSFVILLSLKKGKKWFVLKAYIRVKAKLSEFEALNLASFCNQQVKRIREYWTSRGSRFDDAADDSQMVREILEQYARKNIMITIFRISH